MLPNFQGYKVERIKVDRFTKELKSGSPRVRGQCRDMFHTRQAFFPTFDRQGSVM
jgi:hypothetical protein